MNTPLTSQDNSQGNRLSTADLVNASRAPAAAATPANAADGAMQQPADGAVLGATSRDGEHEALVELFNADVASEFRSRWDAIQIGFVDDPNNAVRQADELVAQVMTRLAETFAKERSELEGVVGRDDGVASTENLRMALRRYRSFFQRLLSL
jgi:hypothetical protein